MGIVTVTVLFVVLAMTIFAVLALSTARQEAELSEKYAAAVTDYYAADAQCVDAVNALAAAWRAGEDAEALAESLGGDALWEGGDLVVSLRRAAGEHTAIDVTVRLYGEGGGFNIQCWRQTSTDTDWTPDETLPVWRG